MSQEFHDPTINKYFSMIEHIVLDKCKGNPFAFMLYCYYKRICGQKQGKCFQRRRTIEENTGIAIATQKTCNRFLKEKGLISITERKKPDRSFDSTLIEIQDIMPENVKKFMVSQEKAGGQPANGGGQPADGLKEELSKKNQNKKKEERERAREGAVSVSFLSFGKYVKLREEDLSILVKENGKEKIDQTIDSINDYLSSTGKKPYKDYAATIRNWLRRQPLSGLPQGKSSLSFVNRHWVTKLKAENYEVFKHMIFIGNSFVKNRNTGADLGLDINPEDFCKTFLKVAEVEETKDGV